MRGILETSTGFRAFVRVKGFPLKSKRFKIGTAADVMKDWRDKTKARLVLAIDEKKAAAPAGFSADIPRYLAAVRALPSYTERVRDINIWAPVFGDTPAADISDHGSVTIKTMRDQWLTVGPRLVQQKGKPKAERWIAVARPLSASAVSHRMRALQNFFTILYPKLDNPVKLVEEPDEGDDVPRSTTYDVLRIVLDTMSDRGRALKGQLREDFSAAKIRASCLAWSGIMPVELRRLTPADNRWRENLVVITSRRKGRGAPGRIVPLTKEGRQAFRELEHRALHGPFNVGVVNRALALACDVAQLPRITCYTFRHSYITGIVAATKNLRLGSLLGGHRDDRTSKKYRMAAEMGVMKDGVAQFHKANRVKRRKVTGGNFRRVKVGQSGLSRKGSKRKNA